MQKAKPTSSTLIKWSAAGLDLSTTYHLTDSRNLGFLKSDMSSVKWQETKVYWGISEEHWRDSKEEGQHGKARTHVSCSTKEDAWSRHLSVDTDTFTSGVEKKDMLKKNAWARRLEWYCWWASTLSSTCLCHFTMLCTFTPYEYTMPYDPPCKLEVLWPWVTTSCLHHYSHDTTSGSHMIMCELHQSLLSWMNLGLMATHYNCFPSSCWVQYKSVVASLSDLLLYSLIVMCSADPRFLSDWLVWWPWTLFSYKKHVSTFNSTEEVFPKLHL